MCGGHRPALTDRGQVSQVSCNPAESPKTSCDLRSLKATGGPSARDLKYPRII